MNSHRNFYLLRLRARLNGSDFKTAIYWEDRSVTELYEYLELWTMKIPKDLTDARKVLTRLANLKSTRKESE